MKRGLVDCNVRTARQDNPTQCCLRKSKTTERLSYSAAVVRHDDARAGVIRAVVVDVGVVVVVVVVIAAAAAEQRRRSQRRRRAARRQFATCLLGMYVRKFDECCRNQSFG